MAADIPWGETLSSGWLRLAETAVCGSGTPAGGAPGATQDRYAGFPPATLRARLGTALQPRWRCPRS